MPTSEKIIGARSIESLVAELETAIPVAADDPGFTSEEFAKAWRVGVPAARDRIRKLIGAGKLVRTGTKRIMRSHGLSDRAPVYDKPRRR